MSRADRIRGEIERAHTAGLVDGYYCQRAMPGLRWVVWGSWAGGAFEWSCGTAEIERRLSELFEVAGA